jgi:putative heme-binding domain-containing protein
MVSDPDPAMARYALSQVGLCSVPQAAAVLAKMVHADGPLRDDAAAAVVQMKSAMPEALKATRHVALSGSFNADLRGNAAAALGAIEGEAARAALMEVTIALDAAPDAPEAVVSKAADSIAAKPVAPAEIDAIAGLLDAAKRPIRVAAATALLRSDSAPVRARVASIFDDAGANRLDAMLAALPRIPAAAAKPYAQHAREALKDRRSAVRRAAISVAGHLKDPESVRELVRLASRGTDRTEATEALAGLAPELVADDQVADVARLLVDAAGDAMKTDRGAYSRLLTAAQKFTADTRVPADRAAELLARLKQPGVIDKFQVAGPIPAADGPASFGTRAPPEQLPAGPFAPFAVGDKTYQWTPLNITDARGLQPLEMPANSMMYLNATIDAPSAGAAILSCASDDGIQVWLNGNPVHANDIDRGALPDMDRVPVALSAGQNMLLVKVNNRSGPAGVQARIRTRVAEFDPAELPELLQRDKIPGDASRGRAVFASVGCNKCHAIDPKEDPKGPFLGDAGAKFDRAHFIESVLNPAAKIAQGFHTQKLTATAQGGAGEADYIGFVTRDSEEIHIRDLTGKVSVLSPENVKARETLPGSIMPVGLAETLSLDDFASLLAYMESLKPQ